MGSDSLGGPFRAKLWVDPSLRAFLGARFLHARRREGVAVWRADRLCTMLPKPLKATVCGGVSMASVDGIQISSATDALRVREGTVWRGLERSGVETYSQNPT